MQRRDRELLARVARINDTAGQVVLAILGDQDRCDPDPVRLRALGQDLSEVGRDCLRRAAELDGLDDDKPVIIDS